MKAARNLLAIYLAIIPGILILVLGLAITGFVSICSTESNCTLGVGALGVPAVGWGVILILVGLVLVAGGAVARESDRTDIGPPAKEFAVASPHLMLCPSCGGRTDRTFQF